MSENALVPIEQKTVLFYDDQITAVLIQQDKKQQVYVPIRPLCDALGLAWSGQYERLQRDPVLSEVSMSVRVTRTDIDPDSRQPRTSEMVCLPLEFVNGWLFGINAGRVKADVRERLLRYQRECYTVLHEAFQEGRLSTDTSFDDLLQQDTEAVQAYRMLQALVKLARNQILIESRCDGQTNQTQRIRHRLRRTLPQIRHHQLQNAARQPLRRSHDLPQRLARKPGWGSSILGTV